MDEVYAWVEDERAKNSQRFYRLLELGRRTWTPQSIFNRCCVKWLIDGGKRQDHYDEYDSFFDEYNVRSGCAGQHKCKRDHPFIELSFDEGSKSTIATLSHRLDPFVTYFDKLVSEGKATKLPHSVYKLNGYLRPSITSLRSNTPFGNHLIKIEKGATEASDTAQSEELEMKQSAQKKPRLDENECKPAAVHKMKNSSTKSEFSDDEEWTEEDFAKIDESVAQQQSTKQISSMLEKVMGIVLGERLQLDLQDDFMSLYSMRCVCKAFKKVATTIATEKLKTLDFSVTPLVNGFEQYGECKIDGYDEENWDAVWQPDGEPTEVFRYDKKDRVKLRYQEREESGAGFYPIDLGTSTFSWNSGDLDLDIDEFDDEDHDKADYAEYAYRGQVMRVYWHPSKADPIQAPCRIAYGPLKPSIGILLASFHLYSNPNSVGSRLKSQGDIVIGYEVLECDTVKFETLEDREYDADNEVEIEIKSNWVKYSGTVRISKVGLDFGVLVRKHALNIRNELFTKHQSILKERPLSRAEKEYAAFVDIAAKRK